MSLEQYQFKYQFRDYQKRILDELRLYLDDDKIHVVAPPGAGKTILALQLMIELNEPTLICVPTVALREQWIQRFTEDFNNEENSFKDISRNLLLPKKITVCTYQALYSIYKNNNIDEEVELISVLKETKIKTIILDEAHHLKKSWWEALTTILNKLDKIKIISLTATPPYDGANKEWNNYLELCGEIDAEISIPELVKRGDLCPHQDYIYFNYPSESDLTQFEEYNHKTKKLYEELNQNDQFITAISLHPGIIHLNDKIDYFINEFDYFISILSFFKYQNITINNEELFAYTNNLPKFDIQQMEILLTYCLFKDKNSYKDFNRLFRDIKRQLNEMGAIEESKVNLIYSLEIKKLLSQNIGKLDSINRIIENEYNTLKENLKLVVVTDYIKEEINDVAEEVDITTMGAIPIFKSIRKDLPSMNVVVLTGKIVIIPTSLKQALFIICTEMNIDLMMIEVNELEYDFDYAKVSLKSSNQRNMVSIMTELFKRNNIQVLVGTSALIGEGWDAPFVNSLIMASFTSTFVMSNQIRGRAIRADKQNLNKTANIWHLICIEKAENNQYRLGADYEMLTRRFVAFEGVSLNKSEINSGIERLNITNQLIDIHTLNQMNLTMTTHANQREKMRALWKEAVIDYIPIKKTYIPKKYTPYLKKHKQRRVRNSLLYSSLSFALGISLIFTNLPYLVIVDFILFSLGFVNMCNGFNSASEIKIIHKLSTALFITLVELGVLNNESSLKVNKENGLNSFYIENGSLKENILFSNAFKELLSIIDTPRYIVEIDKTYYQVPSIIGKNKAWANVFKKHLKHQFRNTKLKYMKTQVGKKELLKLKLKQVNNDEKRK